MEMTTEDWNARCLAFFTKYPSQYATATRSDVDEMFLLHNERCNPKEKKSFCSKCNERTYLRLKRTYESQNA